MGCFDFHYADRFVNMGRRGGYYVIPEYLKKDIGVGTNYIRFKTSDDYGRLFLEKGEQGRYFDIYNLYSIQILSYYKEDLGIDSDFIKRLYDKVYEEGFDIRGLGITFNSVQAFVLSDVNMRYGDRGHYDDSNYLMNQATFEETPLIITMFKPKVNYEEFDYITKSGQNYGRKLKCKWIRDVSYENLLPIERDEITDYNSRYINKKAYEDLKMLKYSLNIYSREIIKKYK